MSCGEFVGSDWSLGMSINRQQKSTAAGGKSPFGINYIHSIIPSIPDHQKVGLLFEVAVVSDNPIPIHFRVWLDWIWNSFFRMVVSLTSLLLLLFVGLLCFGITWLIDSENATALRALQADWQNTPSIGRVQTLACPIGKVLSALTPKSPHWAYQWWISKEHWPETFVL